MTDPAAFTVTTHQNELLLEGDDTADVLLSVAASDTLRRSAHRAEVVVVDNSGSMALEEKLDAAKAAAKAAVDRLDEGVEFAVVVGNDTAAKIWPPVERGLLATVESSERLQAKAAIDGIQVNGATHIGNWLLFARHLFSQTNAQLRHVLLLSDGRDTAQEGVLKNALASCVGEFQCDCLGFGTKWRVEELRGIARALGGQVDMVDAGSAADAEELVGHFRRIVASSQARVLPVVRMRVVTKTFGDLLEIEQSSPEYVPLTEWVTLVVAEPGTTELSLWGWAPGERRDYFLSFRLRPHHVGRIGERVRVAFVELVLADGSLDASSSIEVRWTADRPQATQVEPAVALHFTQREKIERVQAALAALEQGDTETAARHFVEARDAAVEAGDDATASWVGQILDADPAAGAPGLRRVSEADRMRLHTYSTKTGRRDPPPASG